MQPSPDNHVFFVLEVYYPQMAELFSIYLRQRGGGQGPQEVGGRTIQGSEIL